MEWVLSAYSGSHGLRYVALRYFNAAGADTSGEIGEIHTPETHLIPLALKAALVTAKPLTVFGNDLDTPDGTCVRDFIHVMDLGSAHSRAIEYLERGGKSIALNLGTGKGTSIAQLLSKIKEVTGRDVPHAFAQPRAGAPRSALCRGAPGQADPGMEGAARHRHHRPHGLRMGGAASHKR
jgi:UDP-glucose 4-epimerase